MMKKITNTILATLMAVMLGIPALSHAHGDEHGAEIYYNEACSDCAMFMRETLPRILNEYGYKMEKFDYINERENRKLLNEKNRQWEIPFELQSHIETFVDGRIMIGGHVPQEIIRYLIDPQNAGKFGRIIVYQDKMHGEGTHYKVLAGQPGQKEFAGTIKEYTLDTPITVFLDEMPKETKTAFEQSTRDFWPFFGTVSVSAFLDGLNPCAFAVLLFFIAFLFTIRKSRGNVLKIGFIYIFGIFLAYLLIGVGIAQAFVISGAPHLMAKIGAWLVIILGIIQILGYLFPKMPVKLAIPSVSKKTIHGWLYKATVPTAFVGGFIVGLCTFPCSGGIYVAIIGIFTTLATKWQGTWWLIWYNLIFVSPLVIALLLAGNKKAADKLAALEQSSAKKIKLFLGGFMIALGVIILIFFT